MPATATASPIDDVLSARRDRLTQGRLPAVDAAPAVRFAFRLALAGEAPPEPEPELEDPFAVFLTETIGEPPEALVPLAAASNALEPGRRYALTVTAEDAATDAARAGAPQAARLGMRLGFVGSGEPVKGVTVKDPLRYVTLGDQPRFTARFEIEVAAKEVLSAGPARFELLYLPDGMAGKPLPAATIDVELKGDQVPADLALVRRCQVKLDAGRPKATAILNLVGKETLRLWGYVLYSRPQDLGTVTPPQIDLSKYVHDLTPADEIRNMVRGFSFSKEMTAFRTWVKSVLDAGRSLILCDHNDSETWTKYPFPWEMVELGPDQYVGALGTVVRWLPLFYLREIQLDTAATPTPRVGPVVGYVAGPEPENARNKTLLDGLNASRAGSFAEVQKKLGDGAGAIGLVYLFCHGDFSHTERLDLFLESDKYTQDQFRAVKLLNFLPADGERPLFFINACHSARVKRVAYGYEGFPAYLLQTVADAVIGSLTYVDVACATSIAEEFFTLLKDKGQDGACPAEALTRLREKYAGLVTREPLGNHWDMFLFTFLYVFYGNPHARLRLGAGPGPGGA
jgi:hypothetical protein